MGRSTFVLVLVAGIWLGARGAGAQLPSPRTLVMGVRQGERLDAHLAEAVTSRLARMGESVVRERVALPGGGACLDDPGCVQRVATGKADQVVDGEVRGQGMAGSYVVTVRLFDVRRGIELRKEEAPCNDCDADTLERVVADLAGGMFDKELVHQQPPPRVALRVALPKPVVVVKERPCPVCPVARSCPETRPCPACPAVKVVTETAPCPESAKTLPAVQMATASGVRIVEQMRPDPARGRRIAGGVLLGVSLAMLAGMVTSTAYLQSGQSLCSGVDGSLGADCLKPGSLSKHTFYGVGYAISVAGTALGGLLIGLPSRAPGMPESGSAL